MKKSITKVSELDLSQRPAIGFAHPSRRRFRQQSNALPKTETVSGQTRARSANSGLALTAGRTGTAAYPPTTRAPCKHREIATKTPWQLGKVQRRNKRHSRYKPDQAEAWSQLEAATKSNAAQASRWAPGVFRLRINYGS